jgi:outer membrane protein assembly factor BamE (lipoprotein component of BamABCDE complex)
MKKTILAFMLAASLAACATTQDTNTYIFDKRHTGTVQVAQDVNQCKFETSMRHRVKNPRAEGLMVECMTLKGYDMVATK